MTVALRPRVLGTAAATRHRAELIAEPAPSDRQERLLALEELREIGVLSQGEFRAATQHLFRARPTADSG